MRGRNLLFKAPDVLTVGTYNPISRQYHDVPPVPQRRQQERRRQEWPSLHDLQSDPAVQRCRGPDVPPSAKAVAVCPVLKPIGPRGLHLKEGEGGISNLPPGLWAPQTDLGMTPWLI